MARIETTLPEHPWKPCIHAMQELRGRRSPDSFHSAASGLNGRIMEERKRRQIELHRGLAGVYHRRYYTDSAAVVFSSYWNRTIVRFLPAGRRLRVVDCGTGIGFLAGAAARLGHETFGFDLCMEMMQAAVPETCEQVRFCQCDGEFLPYRAHVFDVAISRGLLHHLENWQGAVREIHRILKPGGLFIFSEPAEGNSLIRRLRRIVYKSSAQFDDDDYGITSEQIDSLLGTGGFEKVALEPFGFLAYVLAGFPDAIPVVTSLPRSRDIARGLVRLDRGLARTPLLRRFSLHLLGCYRKI
ncbi:class I SAM-dependent methyltransferase [bacterium]|nr:class I SAM-dependent methyltransferase [candidate division CSSED10-310 bacterium]